MLANGVSPEVGVDAGLRVVVGENLQWPSTQGVDGTKECDVVWFFVFLHVHEDVDEVLSPHCKELHVVLARDSRAAPCSMHQGQLL